MKIYNVANAEFRKYGQVLHGYDFTEIIEKMQETPLPADVIYADSFPARGMERCRFRLVTAMATIIN